MKGVEINTWQNMSWYNTPDMTHWQTYDKTHDFNAMQYDMCIWLPDTCWYAYDTLSDSYVIHGVKHDCDKMHNTLIVIWQMSPNILV